MATLPPPPPGGFRVGSVAYNTLAEALAAANDGNTIVVKPGIYRRQTAVVTRNNLKLIGDNGMVHLAAQGQSIENKGTIVVRGANLTIENFEFSGATSSDGNGAGIRLENRGLTLRRCIFHDNQNGILTGRIADCDLLMEFCEFARNGAGDGQTHNFYIGQIRKLTMLGCYSHLGKTGHLAKSRAAENMVVACRFTDEGGNASYELEFPSGGKVDIRGCVFEQSPSTENNTIISFGAEKNLLNRQHEFRFYQNTVVNRADRGPMIFLATAPAMQDIVDNVFVGTGAPTDPGNTVVSASLLVDPDHFDFRLKQPVKGSHRWASYEYVHPSSSKPRKDSFRGAFSADAQKPAAIVAAPERQRLIIEKPQSGEEAKWWAALPADTWIEVNNTRLDAVQPNPVPPGSIGTEGVVSAYGGGAYDEDNNRLLLFGGGFTASADNSVYELA
ncbi:MAG: right-handed parallel beta-helix repeat-containing protein, partial [Burkholderiales bacterium]|nr:right-handed parallel beta-helix repeat-containing protein [Burkholderiales bacterium]